MDDNNLSDQQINHIKKYVGKRFGNYVIQSQGHKRIIGRRDILYHVQCDCGKFSFVRLQALRNGVQNRCHLCGLEKRFGLQINDNIPLKYNYINNAKRNALRRNLSFKVDRDYLWNIFLQQKGKCAYTRLPLLLDRRWPRGKNLQTASLDRIKSAKGYIKGNVQWVHKDVNQMKMDLSEKRLIELCKLITTNDKRRKN